jgi:hypothetical protein
VPRESKLNEDKQDRIVRLIREGNYASTAAGAAGIGTRTFFRWMKRGEDVSQACEEWDDAVDEWNELTDRQRRARPDLRPDWSSAPDERELPFWLFWQEVKKAEAVAEAEAIGMIQSAANEGTWQAAAWYLERKFKDRWGKTEKVTHEGSIGHEHQLLPQTPQQIEAAQRRLEQARALHSGSQAPELASGDDSKEANQPIDAEVVEIEAGDDQ